MSYYTRLEIAWDDSDYAKGNLTVQEIVDAAKQFVEDNGWSYDVLKDVELAASGDGLSHNGFNGAYVFGVLALMEHISKSIPEVVFFARGAGEEPTDIWFRKLQSGNTLCELGPLEDAQITAPTRKHKPWWQLWK